MFIYLKSQNGISIEKKPNYDNKNNVTYRSNHKREVHVDMGECYNVQDL